MSRDYDARSRVAPRPAGYAVAFAVEASRKTDFFEAAQHEGGSLFFLERRRGYLADANHLAVNFFLRAIYEGKGPLDLRRVKQLFDP
jgi:hypothetical protein